MSPVRNLQKNIQAKRECQIATSFHGHSASPAKGCAYLMHALRKLISGKFLTG